MARKKKSAKPAKPAARRSATPKRPQAAVEVKPVAAPAGATSRFVLLPPRGLRPTTRAASQAVGGFLRGMASSLAARQARFEIEGAPEAELKVLDSIGDDGAKLVEMSMGEMQQLRAAHPGVRVVPEVFYRPAVYQPEVVAPPEAKALASRAGTARVGAAAKIVLTVVAKGSGTSVPHAMVVAFTDFQNRRGAQGVTNTQGKVSLNLKATTAKLDRLYVFPEAGFWGAMRAKVTIKTGAKIQIDAIDVAFTDCVRFFYGNAPDSTGQGVTVGVVDSGVDIHHPDLHVQGGLNTVEGEEPTDFGDSGGEHHGSHVAGIIAARGMPPRGIRGVAPGVALRSYRVFGAGAEGASNFAIAKAIDAAVSDGCDILNMSLGEPFDPNNPNLHSPDDDVLSSAIADARAAGTLVIVAAGNDSRNPVGFPASDPRALAVSAMGRTGTFPAGSESEGDVAKPFGTDKKNFLASFTNVGSEIDLTGPGVGVISTVPGGYAIMSGTSMACPAVVGAAARLVAANPSILFMARDQSRSDAMAKLVMQAARALGFGPLNEGQGLPKA